MPEFGNVVLSRRVGEGIWIGVNRVEVTGLSGGKIRLRISADKRQRVLRDEHVEDVEAHRQAPQWLQLQALVQNAVWVDMGEASTRLDELANTVDTATRSRFRVVDALTGDVVYPEVGQ